jgi:hypothetical protein
MHAEAIEKIANTLSTYRMQENITLNISTDVVASVINNDTDKEQRIIELVTDHLPQLQAMIESYWFAKKANVLNVSVPADSIRFATAVSGYTVSYFFACDDITTNNAESMTCTFDVDLGRHAMTITGELLPERVPDEF